MERREIHTVGGGLMERVHFQRPRRRWEDNIRMNLVDKIWGR
jgi:hypothetical protein